MKFIPMRTATTASTNQILHKGDEMKVKDLKQRQKLRNVKTGEVLQVSKKWDGRFIHLIDPTSKKLVFVLARHAHDKHEAERELTEWVAA